MAVSCFGGCVVRVEMLSKKRKAKSKKRRKKKSSDHDGDNRSSINSKTSRAELEGMFYISPEEGCISDMHIDFIFPKQMIGQVVASLLS